MGPCEIGLRGGPDSWPGVFLRNVGLPFRPMEQDPAGTGISKSVPKSIVRLYREGCFSSHGLDLIGRRWTLPLLEQLLGGPKRFTQLRNALPGLSANLLSQRLRALAAAGIVARAPTSPPSRVVGYQITGWGSEIAPLLHALRAWAGAQPACVAHPPRDPPG